MHVVATVFQESRLRPWNIFRREFTSCYCWKSSFNGTIEGSSLRFELCSYHVPIPNQSNELDSIFFLSGGGGKEPRKINSDQLCEWMIHERRDTNSRKEGKVFDMGRPAAAPLVMLFCYSITINVQIPAQWDGIDSSWPWTFFSPVHEWKSRKARLQFHYDQKSVKEKRLKHRKSIEQKEVNKRKTIT